MKSGSAASSLTRSEPGRIVRNVNFPGAMPLGAARREPLLRGRSMARRSGRGSAPARRAGFGDAAVQSGGSRSGHGPRSQGLSRSVGAGGGGAMPP